MAVIMFDQIFDWTLPSSRYHKVNKKTTEMLKKSKLDIVSKHISN